MTFCSLLFPNPEQRPSIEPRDTPVFWGDLHLDQIIDAITADKAEYDLQPFFRTPLHDLDTIQYRQEIMRDLAIPALFERIQAFAKQMRAMREHRAQADKLYYPRQKAAWFLDAAAIYCQGVTRLAADLAAGGFTARGLCDFRDYLTRYVQTDRFTAFCQETQQVLDELASVRYRLHIKGQRIAVHAFTADHDYSADVQETFAKFRQGAVKQYDVRFPDEADMNHVEAEVLEMVARLYPDVFSHLETYHATRQDYLDETVGAFDREIQFYLAVREYVTRFEREGLPFCYPQVSPSKDIYADETFDAALAHKLLTTRAPVVRNDFSLTEPERILVVSGPNQGGKTTFARMFGQLHYLARLGCPVPGTRARLFLCDQVLTHFEKEETLENLRGKLQDDLIRIHQILSQATPRSIVIMNEIFTSTTLEDAIYLSKQVMAQISRLDLLSVWVTFIDELASFNEKTVSLVSTVVPEQPAVRTYRIVRRPADGLSYALSIAEKHHVTYAWLKERIR
ncbi:MAG: DNA mismatch repair protein MutS [Thermaerobacter sp.]|nr:DNA mismatch repair protein MutS [Thermaerobacter sp.]